jgi:predicted RNA-binding protein with PUA-like domain
MNMKHYWLIKSESDCYSIDDLKRDKKTAWTGIRNYQARNFLKSMKRGDTALFYHSSVQPMGVAGIAMVSKSAFPDMTAQNEKDSSFNIFIAAGFANQNF